MTEDAHQSWTLPHEPPLVTADLPPLGGHLGTEPEDFLVDEIPAYLPSGDGDHRYVRIQKRCLSTPEMVSIVARTAGAAERDIGTAGLKDKHAVTSQWLSLPRRSRPASEWDLPDGIRVLEESYHANKLRTGHLHGNRFTLRLVEISPEAPHRLPALVARLHRGVANAFAEQRFGRDGQNILAAMNWLKDPRQLRGPKARFLSKLYPSVIQSDLFNRYLSHRLALGMDSLLAGEIVRLEGSGSNFVVQELAAEQSRYERGELHPQGPMFGPKMRLASAAAQALEERLLAEVGLTSEQLEQLGNHAPGTRRDVLLRPSELDVVIESTSPLLAARLSFSLPAGSYATHLVRELTHGAWFAPRVRASGTSEANTALSAPKP